MNFTMAISIFTKHTQVVYPLANKCQGHVSASKVGNTTFTWVKLFPCTHLKKVVCVFFKNTQESSSSIADCVVLDVLVVQPGYQNSNNFDSRQVPIFL